MNRDGSVEALADGEIGRPIDPDGRDQIVMAVIDAVEGRAKRNPAAIERFMFPNFSAHVEEFVRNIAH